MDRRAAAAALADAEQQRKVQEDAIAEQRRELADMLAAAAADRAHAGHLRREVDAAYAAATELQKRCAADALAAEQARRDTEATRTAAVAERDAATTARREIDERRALHVAQLSLLTRAADDANGLDLRSSGKTFAMRDWRMTDAERAAHAQPWSPQLVAIARALAVALEGMRDLARRLAGREKAISEREAAAEAREAKLAQDRMNHDAQLANHRAAIADLDRRRQAVDVAETRAGVAISTAEATLASARQMQADADASLSHHRRWVLAMNALEANPDWVEIDVQGRLRLDPAVACASPPELVATLREPAPAWAVALAAQRLDLADALRRADDREREAGYATERLTDMIDKAGPVLTPAQRTTVTDATRIARQFGAASNSPER